MNHIIGIPKDDYSKYKAEKLMLALTVMAEKSDDGIMMDSSGNFYEFFLLSNTDKRVSESLKYFAIGFLQAYELA